MLVQLTPDETAWCNRPTDPTKTGSVLVPYCATDRYTVRIGRQRVTATCFQQAVRLAICYSGHGRNAHIYQNGTWRNTYHGKE